MISVTRFRLPLLATVFVAACSSGEGDEGSTATTEGTGGDLASGGAASGGDLSAAGGGDTLAGGSSGGSASGGMAAGGSGGRETEGTGGVESGGTGGESSSGGATGAGGSEGGDFEGKELFLLIGQSNMSGMSPMPSEPWPINERVTFMVQFDCDSLGQTAGEWLPAQPPLHGCQWAVGGIGLGLGDFFGVKLAEEWPESNIGLIPNAFPGQAISIYLKDGGTEAPVPPGYENAYEMTVERALAAQQEGRIRAILMHQGESDNNRGLSEEWLDKVATVVADLRADLNLGEDVPFLAGEIGPSQWEPHNVYVDQVPDYVPNSAVISAEGTEIHDIAHFDEASARIMGERYVEKFLEMVPAP